MLKSDEMELSIQCDQYSVVNPLNLNYGNRVTRGSMWNNYIPSPYFAESFEAQNGTPFNWDNYCPGYSSMSPVQRSVLHHCT